MKKTVAIAVASLFTVLAPAAHAAYDRNGNYYEPTEYRSSDFREECFNKRTGRYEAKPQTSNRVGGGAVVGAIAGGVLGHQVGSGHGNDAATVGGALIGGLIGHEVEKDRRQDNAEGDLDLSRCRSYRSAYNER